MTATVHPTLAFSTYEPETLPNGPIVIASDASSESDAAFPLAQVLAAHTHADVKVVSVLRPFFMPMYMLDPTPIPMDIDREVRAARRADIIDQVTRLVSAKTKWPIVIDEGDAVSDIVDFAHNESARVVLTGRGRHPVIDRVIGGESVLKMLQLGDTPVYAVEAGMTRLASRVVIATDFSEFSRYAARVALDLIAPDATVHLVHVGPAFEAIDPVLKERADEYRAKVASGFATLREQLGRESMSFEEKLLSGNASDQLLQFVRSIDADLVALATHGFGFLRRMVMGSVATALIRNAQCSVLCVPGSARTQAAARKRPGVLASDARTRTLAPDQLDKELVAFGNRNVGRRCTIEVDHPDLGAQILCHDLPLVGATYDRNDRVASLMFGASRLEGQHLTHSLPNVRSADIIVGPDGKDQLLRLAASGGQTLITLS